MSCEEEESESLPSLEEVEDIIGYKFKDRSLLQRAFTHTTYRDDSCSSYERLEYVGDSVLGLLIAKEHYSLYSDLGPGMLTRLRAPNVDKEKLARVAVTHNLDKYLRHKKPLLDTQIREFKKAILDYPSHSNGLIDAPKDLSDIVESTIGAIFLDSGSSLDTTWKVVEKLLQPVITPATLQIHPVTKLKELCQKYKLNVQFIDLWEKTREIEVFIDGEFIARGVYRSKRSIAINRAAKNAYDEILRRLLKENINLYDEIVRRLLEKHYNIKEI
ncbi:hypothetical protein LguiB_029836 [Lonicera macranthoides]